MGFHDVFTNSKTNPVSESTKVILLTAPDRSVTINFGMEMPSWFDYKQLGFTSLDESINCEELKESQERVTKVINDEVTNNLNGDYSKLFIGGFSQGAALSLYTAFELHENLGAVVCLSGHQLYENPDSQISDSKKSIPVFAYHGEDDPLLPFAIAFPFFTDLKKAGFDIHHYSEAGLAHSLSNNELKKLKEFFAKIY